MIHYYRHLLLLLSLLLSLPDQMVYITMLSIMPLPTMPQPTMHQLTMKPMLMKFCHTPTPMLLLMTTPSQASMLRRPQMVPAMSRDLTELLFLMAESKLSPTLLMDMMDMLLMSPMRELPSIQRPSHTSLSMLLPQPTMHNPSFCHVQYLLKLFIEIDFKRTKILVIDS